MSDSIDIEKAFRAYYERFEGRFGVRNVGEFVKFGKHMIQRLGRDEFPDRLESYMTWRRECEKALSSGATISDVLVMEFEEAAAWVAIEAPNMLSMFGGEFGDPKVALGIS